MLLYRPSLGRSTFQTDAACLVSKVQVVGAETLHVHAASTPSAAFEVVQSYGLAAQVTGRHPSVEVRPHVEWLRV